MYSSPTTTVGAVAHTKAKRSNRKHQSAGFRPEVEGLRALAIGQVLLFHAGVPFLPGGSIGVDVFFVISGFLITGLLIRELENSGRINLVRFWGRRMKRLLPANILVLIVTALGVWLVMPNTVWRSIGQDIAASAVYIVNWRYAANSVDYDAEGAGVSPVLHMWSLSVEEQYYMGLPLLLVLVAWLFIRRMSPKHTRTVIGVALLFIAVPSFVWSLYYTAQNPDSAFFVTTTRLWELGVGAMVAVGAAQWHKIPGWLAGVLGWAGFTVVLAGGFLLSKDAPWPGYLALIPVLGTAAVLIATTGRVNSRTSVAGLLSRKPFVFIGGMSYSWYLWHWPLLVLAQAHFGELRVRYLLLVTLIAGVLAWLSLHLVENPIRNAKAFTKSDLLAVSGGLNLSLIGLLTGIALVLSVPGNSGFPQGVDTTKLGAHALSENAALNARWANADTAEFIVPAPADATSDMPPFNDECKTEIDSAEVIMCEYGDTQNGVTVVAVGDSKIQQLEAALIAAAEKYDWHLITVFKSACQFVDPQFSTEKRSDELCAEWSNSAMQKIIELQPDIVLNTGRRVRDGTAPDGDVTQGAEMIASWWNKLQNAGIRVIPVLDSPQPPEEIYECVAKHTRELSACAFDRAKAIATSGVRFQQPAMEMAGITEYADFTDIICPVGDRCPAVIGNVLVYRQGSHVTNTYVETMADVIGERLNALITSP